MNNKIILNILKNKSTIIFKITFYFLVFGFVYIFFSEHLYKSSITLYPAGELSENNSILSELSEYTETFGVSMPTKSNYYIPDIINSYSLKKEIVLKTWKTEKFKEDINLINYWEINSPSYIKRFIHSLQFTFNRRYYDENLFFINSAIKKLDNLISVDEAYSGLIEVDVLSNEPKLSADIANYISNYVIDFVNSEQKRFATKTKQFTKKRFELSEHDLIKSEDKLTEFRKIHPMSLDTPELQLERLRLIREVEVNQEVFVTLRNQLEIAKIEESKERLFVNILDRAEPSIRKEHPRTLLLLIIFGFLGFAFSLSYLIILNNFKKE